MVIIGGYYIKARSIQNSEIAIMPPHVREIWDWIIMKANHSDRMVMGKLIKRGQLFTSYNEIRAGLSWKIGWRTEKYTKWQCEEAMKKLRTLAMITTQKTTRGILIEVVNYSHYQDPNNYEDHTEDHNENHNSPQTRHTIHKNDKNEKNNIYNGDEGMNSSPIQEKENAMKTAHTPNGVESLQSILASKVYAGQTPVPAATGITRKFQDDAFMCATFLKIDLTDNEVRAKKLTGRFMRLFKIAETDVKTLQAISKAKSYLSDYAPFHSKSSAHKIMYFFEIVNNYQTVYKTL